MKNSKLKFKNIGFALFTAMFFLSVNLMAQQKIGTLKAVAPKKIVTTPVNKKVTAIKIQRNKEESIVGASI